MNCASCGAALPEGAMFCGNCGRAVNAITLPRDRLVDPRPGDTTVLLPRSRSATAPVDAGRDAPQHLQESVVAEPAEYQAPPVGRHATGPAADAGAQPGADLNDPATEPQGSPHADPGTEPQAGPHADSVANAEAGIPTGPIPPVPYVLSFSTGERIVVVGAGLLGRRPFAQPNERFDQLVSIADHQRSVSKTHLEFGVENGQLWVCDRYSANGTVIIPPAGGPHRCEPGRRYRVPRGGRVEIGDHWFDVR